MQPADTVYDDSNTRVLATNVALGPVIRNPLKVVDEEGRVLGAAVVSLANGAFWLQFFLRKDCPESFDLDVEPGRVRVELRAQVEDEEFEGLGKLPTLTGTVVLHTR